MSARPAVRFGAFAPVSEIMACDYFIVVLDHSTCTFALKVRERSPKDLDAALRAAFQFEVHVWSDDVNQSHSEGTRREQWTNLMS